MSVRGMGEREVGKGGDPEAEVDPQGGCCRSLRVDSRTFERYKRPGEGGEGREREKGREERGRKEAATVRATGGCRRVIDRRHESIASDSSRLSNPSRPIGRFSNRFPNRRSGILQIRIITRISKRTKRRIFRIRAEEKRQKVQEIERAR